MHRWLLTATLVASACSKPPPPTCEDSEDFACFTGVFSSLLGARIEGVEVCTPDLPDIPCTTSDADGGWQIPGLPQDTDILVTATYEDTIPTVFPQNSSRDWYAWYKVMVPQAIINTHANRLDVELDDSRGHLLFLTWEGLNIDGDNTPNVSDVVGTLQPAAAMFYSNSIGLASNDLTATSGSGSGGALNLEPGQVTATFDGPGGPCTEPSFHYASEEGQIPVPILAGFATAIDVICPPAR